MDKTQAVKAKQIEYDALPKKPLQIEFEMASPFSAIHLQHLDGILAYHSLLRLFPEDFFDMQELRPPLDSPLPLERCENESGQWWWAASAAKYEMDFESIARWKKRWDDQHDYLVKKPEKKLFRVDHKAGHYKAYDMPIPLRSSPKLAFCCIGNPKEVERLLSEVTHLGKKRSQGWGKVKDIHVSESNRDWSCWDIDGRPTRAIPVGPNEIKDIVGRLGNVRFANVAYRAPYWWPGNKGMCVVP